MKTLKIALAVLLFFGLVGFAVPWVQGMGGDVQKIRKALEELGSSKVMVREEAARYLMEVGEEAIPFLERAAACEDDDISRRARWILMEMHEEGMEWEEEEEEVWEFPMGGIWTPRDFRFHYPEGMTWQGVQDLEEYLEEMRAQIDEQLKSLKDRPRGFSQKESTVTIVIQKDGQKMTYNREKDGRVKVTITGEDSGEGGTKTYTAANMEEFKENYPEVYEKMGLGRFSIEFSHPELEGFSFAPPMKRFGKRFGLKKPRGRRWIEKEEKDKKPFIIKRYKDKLDQIEEEEGEKEKAFFEKFTEKKPSDTKGKLGVYFEDLGDVARKHLGLEKGEGILVVGTVQGSLAEKLEIKANDVILKVNGVVIQGAEDVKKGLMKGGPLAVEILRKGERKILTEEE